jgi:hypothetical protein
MNFSTIAPVGKVVKLIGCESFYLEGCCDYMKIYDTTGSMISSKFSTAKSNTFEHTSSGQSMEITFTRFLFSINSSIKMKDNLNIFLIIAMTVSIILDSNVIMTLPRMIIFLEIGLSIFDI